MVMERSGLGVFNYEEWITLNLDYKVYENGYTIYKDGIPWMEQEGYSPHPGKTLEESAMNHILHLIEVHNNPPLEGLDPSGVDLHLAIAELAEKQEQDKADTLLALAELAESIAGVLNNG